MGPIESDQVVPTIHGERDSPAGHFRTTDRQGTRQAPYCRAASGATTAFELVGRLVYSIIAAVAEMERVLLIERTMSGLAAGRARGRKGGRKREFSPAAVRKACGHWLKPPARERYDLSVAARFAGVSRRTLYRYLTIKGERGRSAAAQPVGRRTVESL